MENRSLVLRISAIAIALVLVVGVVWLKNKGEQERVREAEVSVSWEDQEIDASLFDKDTDGDELRDWEESLWGTDINNPDSDGDGATDTEEIAANRDPRVAGPNDTLSQESIPAYSREDEANLTVSESFQKDFFDELLTLREEGDISKTSLDQMLTELTEEYLSEPKVSKEYLLSDLRTDPDNSKEAIKEYVNKLGNLVQNYDSLLTSEDILAVQDAFTQSANEGTRSELATLAQRFTWAQNDLVEVRVPSVLSAEHVGMLNGISTMRISLNSITATAETDPLNAILELNSFRAGLLLFSASVQEVRDYANENGIEFTNNDPAHAFLEL